MRIFARLCILLASLLLGAGWARAAPAPAEPRLPIDVRVGLIAYDDLKDRAEYFTRLTRDLLEAEPTSFHTKLAFGTYDEVAHWIEEKTIDLAAVSPGVYVDLERKGLVSANQSSPFILLARETMQPHPIQCFSKSGSPLKDLESVKNVSRGGQLTLLAPDTLSASGFMLPWDFLEKNGVRIEPSAVQLTYSHSNALRFLKSGASTDQMACVWSGVISEKDIEHLQSISLPGLESITTPDNVILARKDFARGAEFIRTLTKVRPTDFKEERSAAVMDQLRGISEKLSRFNFPGQRRGVPIDDIIRSLTQYATTQPLPPRVALVLSGGGAKCAYQLGAVRALEEKLADARQIPGLEQLDINLVVGTSGGAVNALPVAMGLTKTEAGAQSVRAAWNDMDQRELIRPPLKVRLNLGFWLGAAQLLIYLNIRRLLTRKAQRRVGVVFIVIGLIEMLLGCWPYKPWSLLGQSSSLHHFWLWLSLGVAFAGALSTALGTAIVLSPRIRHAVCVSGALRRTLVFMVILLPLIQTWVVLFYENTLTDGHGLEAVLKRNYQRIIKEDLQSQVDPSRLENADIREISELLIHSGKRERDLVLTASPLAETGAEINTDLYFYLAGERSSASPRYGEHGVSLAERPRDLLTVLLGSAAIYPIFPARTLSDFPRQGKTIKLVDGSFAHRSPLEAAVLWGATHVIVIEASPIEPPVPSGFAGNMAIALNLLYEQAQLTDQRVRGITPIYTLFPKVPQIGLLDFSDNLIDFTIDKGYREAAASESGGSFIKEHGSPVWWDPVQQ